MSSPVALLAIADESLRSKINFALTSLRWQVFEMSGGAETLCHLEAASSRLPMSDQAIIVDKNLPDLDISEFCRDVQFSYPHVDLVSVDGSMKSKPANCASRRGELMHDIRTSMDSDPGEFDALVPVRDLYRQAPLTLVSRGADSGKTSPADDFQAVVPVRPMGDTHSLIGDDAPPKQNDYAHDSQSSPLPDFIGSHPVMLEVSRRIRLVAPRSTSVLIQGPTGTGKELVARATHRMSPRHGHPFIVLNCAAIPESLLEAELFGHTRGAFTGAIQRRIGRVEAAHGGTLFLDEIGELPLSLQSKLLRVLESGEIQRVGDNATHIVDVRIVAATHQHLAARSRQGTFRADLFHRLAVFTIKTPALSEHATDIPLMAERFLAVLCQGRSTKRLNHDAKTLLLGHTWPGNVRELAHVIERAFILSENRPDIQSADIEFDSLTE